MDDSTTLSNEQSSYHVASYKSHRDNKYNLIRITDELRFYENKNVKQLLYLLNPDEKD